MLVRQQRIPREQLLSPSKRFQTLTKHQSTICMVDAALFSAL
jgi:hypothetical protein